MQIKDNTVVFQSTLPVRGATSLGAGVVVQHRHFNPRSPCGERLHRALYVRLIHYISIHAPRAGSDGDVYARLRLITSISIHAPRAGSDEVPEEPWNAIYTISIHAPRAGSDVKGDTRFVPLIISIHAPRAGSDNADKIHTKSYY